MTLCKQCAKEVHGLITDYVTPIYEGDEDEVRWMDCTICGVHLGRPDGSCAGQCVDPSHLDTTIEANQALPF